MAEEKLELRRMRDFGENINDSFLFIRENFRPLLKSFLAICAVFMIAQGIMNGLYQSHSIGIFRDIFSGGGRTNINPLGRILTPEYFLMILTTWLTILSMNVAIGAYIKYYLQHDGTHPQIEEVWDIFKKYFFLILVYSIPIYLVIIIGYFFCLVPGIYFWVAFVPFTMVIMIEENDFGYSFTRCFDLLKDNFWPSFGIYVVAYLIYSVSGLIIGGIVSMIIGFAGYFTTDDLTNSLAVATSILNLFTFCFYIIFCVSAALNYFNLVERRDGTGILNRIDSIGKNKNDTDRIEEQY